MDQSQVTGGEIRDPKELCVFFEFIHPSFLGGSLLILRGEKNYISNRNPPKVFLVRFGYLAKWVEYHHVNKKSHTHTHTKKELSPSPYLHLSHKNSLKLTFFIAPWKTPWLMDVLFLRVFGFDYHSQLRWARISLLHGPLFSTKMFNGPRSVIMTGQPTLPLTYPLQK